MKRKIACSTKCRDKKKFKNQQEAQKRAEEIELKGTKLYYYKCNACDGWHLTKKTKKKKQGIRKKIEKFQKKHDDSYEREMEKEAEYWKNKKQW